MTTKGSGAIQVVDWDTVNLLRPFFDKGPDPVSARLLDLPVLRGAWACSVDSGGNWYDISGHGHMLTYNGNPTFNYDGLMGYWDLDGTGDFFTRADEADLDISGTESYVAVPGLTLGGWFQWDSVDTVNGDGLIWKSDLANQRAYELFNLAQPIFRVSQNGAATTQVISSVTLATGAWYCIIARFFPNFGLYIDVNGTTDVNLAAPPASIFNSNQQLEVGIAAGIAATALDGRVASIFLCAAALSDAQVNVFYQMTKRLFGH